MFMKWLCCLPCTELIFYGIVCTAGFIPWDVKTGMFVFITLYDSWSSCVAEVRGWETFWCVTVVLESEEVGHGLNIPGGVVGGDDKRKEKIADTRLWWMLSCLYHLVVCYKGLPPEGKGGCNYGKMEGKKWWRWIFRLSFISPVHFVLKRPDSIWLCE